MILIPAVDIKNAKCVRLTQGESDREKVYSSDPVEMAQKWVDAGAKRLHIIDLDGAFEGRPKNLDIVAQIKKKTGAFVQMGGGLRTAPVVKSVVEAGIDKVILGTVVFTDPYVTQHIFESFGDKVMVAMDVRDGYVSIRGWTDSAGVTVSQAIQDVEKMGCKEIIFTDISRDGMMEGVNLNGIQDVMGKTKMTVYASGGVTSLSDLENLKAIQSPGAVVGKALYEGNIDLAAAIQKVQ